MGLPPFTTFTLLNSRILSTHASVCCDILSLWLLAGVQAGHQGHSKGCASARSVVGDLNFIINPLDRIMFDNV